MDNLTPKGKRIASIIFASILVSSIFLSPILGAALREENQDTSEGYMSIESYAEPIAFGNVGFGPNWFDVGADWTLYDDGTIVVGGGYAFGGFGWDGDPWGFFWADIPIGFEIERIVFTEPIVGGANLSWLFGVNDQYPVFGGQRPWFRSLRYIEGLHYLDTSNTTNMSNMFHCATSLTSIDVGHFDTSNVTNMMYMFGCGGARGWEMGVTELDVSNFATGRVTNMFGMFEDSSSLSYIDVSNWDVGSVTNMSQLFFGMRSLSSINVSSWDTSSVTNMSSLFYSTETLTTIDVSNWDTSRTTNMEQVFMNMPNLMNIDLSNWDTGNVTTMARMFNWTPSLRSLDINSWDTSRVANMAMMFWASGLEELDLSNWNTNNVTNMSLMLDDARNLERLNIEGFNTSNVISMTNMLRNTTALRELTLGAGWQTVGNPALPNVPTNATYTGRWRNVANGTVPAPAGTYRLTSSALMNTAGGRPPIADTWVWEVVPQYTVEVYLSATNARVGTRDIAANSISEWLLDILNVTANRTILQDSQENIVEDLEDAVVFTVTDFAGTIVTLDPNESGQYIITVTIPSAASGVADESVRVILTVIPLR